MASDRKTVDFIVQQIAGAGIVSAWSMFGEDGVCCDSKMVAIVGDDHLFLKPTPRGRAFAAEAAEQLRVEAKQSREGRATLDYHGTFGPSQ